MGKLNRTDVYATNEVCQRLGFTVSSQILIDLGLEPEIQTQTGVYWRKSDYPVICMKLAQYILDGAQGWLMAHNEVHEMITRRRA